ncbi:TonB-dependent receptor [Niveispirillum sp. KHB5.9]|uniref:TonB-dependent receptor n=1 Tax=Niveispirillum sp. KHB5.9 TaxID=3400269 RepID=UPI003A8BC74A
MSKRSTILLGGTALAALLALPATAQETGLLEEIVVTANRRAESVQDAPAAISALTASALEEKSITAVEGIAALVPGVQISTYQGDTSIFIRGIGTPTIIAGTDSSTATYIDGVYISRAAAIGPAFFDVDRIEVLRGPQGTLYGRNATSGAVSIITKGPTDSLEAEGRLILGNYQRIQANGAVSGPLSEHIRARLAAQAENHDGYAKVVRPRGTLPPTQPDITQDVGDKDDVSVRLKLEADLSETATLGLSADYYHADDRSNVYYFASAGYGEEIPGWYATREGSQTLPYFAIKNSGRVTAPKSRTLYADTPYFNKSEVWGLAGDLKWDIGEHVLAVNASYRATHPVSQNEFDLSDSFNNYVGRAEDHWQASGDVQLSSPTGQRFS